MTEAEWLSSADPRPMLEYLKGPESVEQREMWGRLVSITTYPAKRMSERKARLFAVACCRQLSDLYDEAHCRRVIDYGRECDVFQGRGLIVPEADCCQRALALAERAADEPIAEDQLRALAEAAEALHHPAGDYAASHDSANEYEHQLVATGQSAYAIHFACSDYPVRYGVFGQPSGAFENLVGVVWRNAQAALFQKGLTHAQRTEGGDPDNMAVNADLLREVVGNPFRPVSFSPSWHTSTAVALASQMYESRDFSAMPILADALQDAGCDNADVLDHCRGPGPHVRGCWVVDLVLGKE